MYNASGSQRACGRAQLVDRETAARLERLTVMLARDSQSELRERLAHDEALAHPFERPVPERGAFEEFGACLGLLPPAAVFMRLLWHVNDLAAFYWLLILAGLMNIVCYEVGRRMAARLWPTFARAEDYAWALRLMMPGLIGVMWGLVTGGAGGFLFFGVGAFFGSIIAATVGAFGFTLYASLQRMFARGGMIESRHAWPLALGVNGLIVALILLA